MYVLHMQYVSSPCCYVIAGAPRHWGRCIRADLTCRGWACCDWTPVSWIWPADCQGIRLGRVSGWLAGCNVHYMGPWRSATAVMFAKLEANPGIMSFSACPWRAGGFQVPAYKELHPAAQQLPWMLAHACHCVPACSALARYSNTTFYNAAFAQK
jgi:hypothetical protein